jgi:hypothetical protein
MSSFSIYSMQQFIVTKTNDVNWIKNGNFSKNLNRYSNLLFFRMTLTEGIIQLSMKEIERTIKSGLDGAIDEFGKNCGFNISAFIWSQENQTSETKEPNVDWARKNLSLRARSYHPVVVKVVKTASDRFDLLLKDVKMFTNDRSVLRSNSKVIFLDYFILTEFFNKKHFNLCAHFKKVIVNFFKSAVKSCGNLTCIFSARF